MVIITIFLMTNHELDDEKLQKINSQRIFHR